MPRGEAGAGKVSGAWGVRGTQVPVQAFFENLADGAGLGKFLAWFSGMSREQMDAVLEHAAFMP